MATSTITWDEPAGASSARGWLYTGANVTGFYLDYGPEHYRTDHLADIGGGRIVSFCGQPGRPDHLCRECQPGNILAVRYPNGPGTEPQASRYVETVSEARAYVESGE